MCGLYCVQQGYSRHSTQRQKSPFLFVLVGVGRKKWGSHVQRGEESRQGIGEGKIAREEMDQGLSRGGKEGEHLEGFHATSNFSLPPQKKRVAFRLKDSSATDSQRNQRYFLTEIDPGPVYAPCLQMSLAASNEGERLIAGFLDAGISSSFFSTRYQVPSALLDDAL